MQAIQSDQSRKQRNTILVGFMDFEKGFDSIEHQAMFEALQKMNPTWTSIPFQKHHYNHSLAINHSL